MWDIYKEILKRWRKPLLIVFLTYIPAVGLAAYNSFAVFHTFIGGFVVAGLYMAALMFIGLAMMMEFRNKY